MAELEGPEDLQDDLRRAWHRFVDMLVPLRPPLHAYCRKLVGGDIWDAEDLVQDTLLRAFGHLGFMHREVRNPRAYLLRTATNVWIDGLRRRRTADSADPGDLPAPSEPPAPDSGAKLRSAGAQLIQRLTPQKRAAVLLKDMFDMETDEIALLLSTTPGAVKTALHRGRARLAEPEGGEASQRPRPSKELVDAFVDLYYAKDVAGLVALMADGGAAENIGFGLEYGQDNFRDSQNFLYKAVHGHEEWPAELQPESVRIERGELDGEPIVLCFATRGGREALEQILRLEETDGRIARLRGYAFCPETMRAAGEILGLPVRTGLYRVPTPAPGEYWPDAGDDHAE